MTIKRLAACIALGFTLFAAIGWVAISNVDQATSDALERAAVFGRRRAMAPEVARHERIAKYREDWWHKHCSRFYIVGTKYMHDIYHCDDGNDYSYTDLPTGEKL